MYGFDPEMDAANFEQDEVRQGISFKAYRSTLHCAVSFCIY